MNYNDNKIYHTKWSPLIVSSVLKRSLFLGEFATEV